MRKSVLVLSLFFCVAAAFGQTMTADGNWNDATKWSGGNIGDAITENVTFSDNVKPTILGTAGINDYTVGTISFGQNNEITIQNGGKLTLGSSSSSKSMTTGMNAKINVNSGGTLVIWGNLAINSNIVLTIAGSLIVHGNVTVSGSNSNFNVTGSIQVDGNFTGSGNNDTNITGSGKITVNGNVNIPSGNLNGPSKSFIAKGSCTGTYCSSSALPIQLVSFNAQPSVSNITLQWSTLSEQNFDFFILEKSLNGTDFYEIARIAGHGTTTVRHDYQWTDEKAHIGKNYYRLTEVDLDQSSVQFQTIMTDYSGNKKLNIYPNPVASQGDVTLELNFQPNQEVAVSIFDIRGAIISEFTLAQHNRTFPVQLASGMYLVVLRGNNFRTSSNLVVR